MKLVLVLSAVAIWMGGFVAGLWAGRILAQKRLLKLIGTGRLLIAGGYSHTHPLKDEDKI